MWDWPWLLRPNRPHRGRVGTKRPSPGAGLCGAGRLCCTQAAPTGGGWVQQTQPRGRFAGDWLHLLHPSRPTGGGWVQKDPALGPGCVGLAASAAPRPPPPGAGGHKKTQPWGRVVWGWPPLLRPNRPHRGRVGTKRPSPGAGLCGTGRLCCTQAAPPGASGYKIQPRGRFVWDWPPLLHPGRPHRGRVGTKRPSPGAGLCGAGRLCCTQAAPTGGGWAQKHTAPRPVCAELAAGLLHRRRMMKKRRRKG